MTFLIIKYLITAFLVVFISEISKQNDKLGALISSLPIVTILVIVWLYVENQGTEKISKHAFYTFWYVIPTLPMFLIIPFILSKGMNFWVALSISMICTIVCFIFIAILGKKFGVELIP